jgi:hypothetical protein
VGLVKAVATHGIKRLLKIFNLDLTAILVVTSDIFMVNIGTNIKLYIILKMANPSWIPNVVVGARF